VVFFSPSLLLPSLAKGEAMPFSWRKKRGKEQESNLSLLHFLCLSSTFFIYERRAAKKSGKGTKKRSKKNEEKGQKRTAGFEPATFPLPWEHSAS
jgi:hypothetical protein